MNDQDQVMTSEQARATLEQAQRTALATPHDRKVHGWATAGFGTLVGGYVGLYQFLPAGGLRSFVTVAYVALLIALAGWQTKAIRSWPRHSKVTGYVGLAATLVLAGIGTMGLNLLESRTGTRVDISALWYAVAAIVIAAPMLVAGWIIGHRRA